MLKNNILLLCLSGKYARKIGEKLANKLEMFFVDVNDILEYNLVNNSMLQNFGIEYYKKEQRKVVLSISQYENSLVTGNMNLFFENDVIEKYLPNFTTIYLKFEKESLKKIEIDFELKNTHIAFEEEDKICSHVADIIANLTEDETFNLKILEDELLKYVESENGKHWKFVC